jgi:hypothetical protein
MFSPCGKRFKIELKRGSYLRKYVYNRTVTYIHLWRQVIHFVVNYVAC